MTKMLARRISLSPPQMLSLTFLALIIIGTGFLKLPISTTKGITWLDAFFTSTSAVTVTGLIVVDTGQMFTVFGQVVILLLIQTGGLGLMTSAVFILILLGRKIGLKERLLIGQSLNQSGIGGIIYLVKKLFIITLVAEFLGALFLSVRWAANFGWEKAIYAGIFHSISAFNSAGFSIWKDSLSRFVGDPVVNIVITTLFMIGGIGFTVLVDLWSKKKISRLSLHSKLMLTGTLVINMIAILLLFILEYDNPHTLGGLSKLDKLWAAYFQGVAPRTAGFNTVDIGSMNEITLVLVAILMFIGGGSGSTSGGIKLTTFLLLLFSTIPFLQGKSEMVVFKRTITKKTIVRSIAITMIGAGIVFIGILILSLTEKNSTLLSIVFESFSAFGTAGLTMGLTSQLSWMGKVLLICMMFIGKIGPLTLAFSFAKPKERLVHYPEEGVLTG